MYHWGIPLDQQIHSYMWNTQSSEPYQQQCSLASLSSSYLANGVCGTNWCLYQKVGENMFLLQSSCLKTLHQKDTLSYTFCRNVTSLIWGSLILVKPIPFPGPLGTILQLFKAIALPLGRLPVVGKKFDFLLSYLEFVSIPKMPFH